jgi:cell division protein FtsB
MNVINKNKRSRARLKLGLVLGILILSCGLVIASMAFGAGQGSSEELQKMRDQVAIQKGDMNKLERSQTKLQADIEKLQEEKANLESQLEAAAQSSGGGADVELWKMLESCLNGKEDLEGENRRLRESLEACRDQLR